MTKATLPSAQTPVLDQGGLFNLSWRRFVEALWLRTGRGQDIDITATSNTVLTFSFRGSDGVVRSGTVTLS